MSGARVSVLELLVVGPQLIVVSTLLLHVGRRFLKSLRPSVEISDTTLVFNKMCFPLTPVSPPRLQLAGPSRGVKFYTQTTVVFDLFNMLLRVLLYVMSEREAPSALTRQLWPALQA